MCRCGILNKFFIFILFYTLIHLLLMTRIYVTNHTHRTSINIRVHQYKGMPRDQNDDRTEVAEDQVHTSTEPLPLHPHNTLKAGELFSSSDEYEDVEYMDNTTNEEKEELLYGAVEEQNVGYMENVAQLSNSQLEESSGEFEFGSRTNGRMNKSQLFSYDHPVLRRIEDKNVFYISAIADENGLRNLPVTPQEGTDNPPVHLHSSDQEGQINKTIGGIERTNWIKSPSFLQPLSMYINTTVYGTITLNGWEGYRHTNNRYFCCYRYADDYKKGYKRHKTKNKSKNNVRNNVPQASLMLWKNIWNQHNMKIIKAAQFVCPVDLQHDGSKGFPTKVALTTKENCKTKQTLKYIDVERQVRDTSDSIGVCAKLVYGNYPAERLIEWFEFNKLMGVNRIMLFTYDVTIEVKIVLDYYAQERLLITKEFDIPAKGTFTRKPGGKNTMAFQDEQVAVFDCVERFNDFRFVAVLDLDEFLVPAEAVNVTGTWRTMLSKLLKDNPNASGFVFHTQIFTLDWGISNQDGNLFVTKYIKRTKKMWDRRKNIIIPEGIQRGMVWTHSFTSVAGYTRVNVPPRTATIFHYRKCRREWMKRNRCMAGHKKIPDKTMVLVMSRIESNILTIKNKLLW